MSDVVEESIKNHWVPFEPTMQDKSQSAVEAHYRRVGNKVEVRFGPQSAPLKSWYTRDELERMYVPNCLTRGRP